MVEAMLKPLGQREDANGNQLKHLSPLDMEEAFWFSRFAGGIADAIEINNQELRRQLREAGILKD